MFGDFFESRFDSWQSDRILPLRQQSGIIECDRVSKLEEQVSHITELLSNMQASWGNKPNLLCELCQGDHHVDQCCLTIESLQFVNEHNSQGNYNWRSQGNNPWWPCNQGGSSSTYNQSMMPNYQSGVGDQNHDNPEEEKSSLEEALYIFIDELRNQNNEKDRAIEDLKQKRNQHAASMHCLEVQGDQFARTVHSYPQKSVPSDIVEHLKGKEQCHAITLWSSKEVKSQNAGVTVKRGTFDPYLGLDKDDLQITKEIENMVECCFVDEAIEEITTGEIEVGAVKEGLELSSVNQKVKPSVVEQSKLEVKPLPAHPKSAFLENKSTLPVVISSTREEWQEEKLVSIWDKCKEATWWVVTVILGISLTLHMLKILWKGEEKPMRDRQGRLNPIRRRGWPR